jgi:hypothetical protein
MLPMMTKRRERKGGSPRLAKTDVFAISLPPGSDTDSELILVIRREWPGTLFAPRKWERELHIYVPCVASWLIPG